MGYRLVLLLAAVPAWLGAADWDARKAAEYLDSRQTAWDTWPRAQKPGGACLSCHTGTFYLVARPALRAVLHETSQTASEHELLSAVRSRAGALDPTAAGAVPGTGTVKGLLADQLLATQSVLTPFVLAYDDQSRGKLSPEAEEAFRRMWSLQLHTGAEKGGWVWSSFDLDPWEMPDSAFFGAALAAVATGVAPAGYQDRPEIRASIAELRDYIRAHESAQPLHNRLIALWGSAHLRDLLPDATRHLILEKLWHAQSADGGFSLPSLGPWKPREVVPATSDSNAYATALAAFAAGQAGVSRKDQNLAKALAWLRAHQDPQDGSWPAFSMNKQREPDSMPARFMRDAATAFAVMALAN